MKFVVDTSVAMKRFVNEEGRANSLRLLRDDIYRIAPDLVFVEAANAFRKKVKLGEIAAEQADRAIKEMLVGFFQTIVSAAELVENAFELANKIDHPVPDCCFLALAIATDSRLVTADDRFVERSEKYFANIVKLGDLPGFVDMQE